MKFFFDENLPKWLATGMREFRQDTSHLLDEFPSGTLDVDWLPTIGERGWFLISRDANIRRRPAELNAFRKHNVGGFVLAGKDLNGWGIVEQLVRNWRKIMELAETTSRPFLFRVPPGGAKIVKIPL